MKDESLPLPPGQPAHSADEIAAEIADHLASSEAELTKRGVEADQARAAAREKFGDVEKIQKTCYWIQNGETLMTRWTLIALASALCILLGLSVLGNWRTQSQLAEEMGKLSAELKALAAAKEAPPPTPQPPEIKGVIYAGSKKPVAGANVAVLRSDGSVVRRMTSDAAGTYRSGPLESGDYFVTAPLVGGSQDAAKRVVQSEPIFVHGASGIIHFDLDSQYPAGALDVSIDHKLPEVRKDGKYLITTRLNVFVIRSREREHLWTAKEDVPVAWPVYSRPTTPSQPMTTYSANGIEINGVVPASQFLSLVPGEFRRFQQAGLNTPKILPTGETEVEGTLIISVWPLNEEGKIVMGNSQFNSLRTWLPSIPRMSEASSSTPGPRPFVTISTSDLGDPDGYGWQNLSGAQLWLSKLRNFAFVDVRALAVKNPPRQKIVTKEGEATKIVFKIPANLEEEVTQAVETTVDPDKFEALIRERFFRRLLTFEVVGNEPLEK